MHRMKRHSKQRIGAACKWTELDGTQRPELNFKTSTARYLNGLEPVERHEYLMAVVQHNLRALRSQIRLVGSQPPALRMWRLGSDLLPLRTHSVAASFYSDPDVDRYINNWLRHCGKPHWQNPDD